MKKFSIHEVRWTMAALAAIMILTLPAAAPAALNAYLYLKINGTDVPGDVTQTGREGSIEVNSFASELEMVFDDATGQPTGAHAYEPIVFLKPIDKATPVIMGALIEGGDIDAEFRFYRPTTQGAELHYMTIELQNARVARIRRIMPDNLVPENMPIPVREEVAFKFDRIRVKYEPTEAEYNDGVTTATARSTTGILMSEAAPAKPSPEAEGKPAN